MAVAPLSFAWRGIVVKICVFWFCSLFSMTMKRQNNDYKASIFALLFLV